MHKKRLKKRRKPSKLELGWCQAYQQLCKPDVPDGGRELPRTDLSYIAERSASFYVSRTPPYHDRVPAGQGVAFVHYSLNRNNTLLHRPVSKPSNAEMEPLFSTT